MIQVVDMESMGIPAAILPEGFGGQVGSADSASCQTCASYRPAPQISGNLQVDPEIHLPSVGIDVDLAYFYNASSTANGVFGYGRTLSSHLTAQACPSPSRVTLTRGNGAIATFQ